MRSLKWKLVLIYVALVFIVMIISGTFIIVQTTNIETERIKEDLELHASLLYEQILLQTDEAHFQDTLNQLSKNTATNSDIQSSILTKDGQTIATNAFQGVTMPTYNNSAVISAIAGTAKFDKGKWEDATGIKKEWLNYAKPYDVKGTRYIIYAQSDIGQITSKASSTTRIILFSSLIALIFSVIIGTMFADTITKPIITLTKKAKEMARGKLNVSIDVKSHDEIGQLTKNFNVMSIELNNTMSAISSEKNKLETLLHNMTDGVLAFNQYGHMIHANSASRALLGLGYETNNINYDKVAEMIALDMNYRELLSGAEAVKAEKQIGKKFISATLVPYADVSGKPEGVVAVLQDLSEQKALDDMRKEFVANVSHEIRTPLTTIKTYAETLMDGDIDDRRTSKEFLSIIGHETDRMAHLVTDLLQLSSLDNNKLVMNIEEVDIVRLVEINIMQCKVLADNKNQKIVYHKPIDDLIVEIDKSRSTQVITNIISNAVKYSPENTTITITLAETERFIIVEIDDEGMGIPPEDLPRIFERFYRVDKARSREMGGTGLGLAIAKEIMENMGGFIDAESAPGAGTKMSLYFPKNAGKYVNQT